MYDSVAISQDVTAAPPGWLLLIHQIPPTPHYFRVKIRRRLQQLGAVALKNSVYVLPNTDDAVEDFQWLRRAVEDEGGEATLCAASFLEGIADEEVVEMFRAQSDEAYDELIDAARAVGTDPSDADVRRFKKQLAQTEARDFFAAPHGEVAREAVRGVEAALARRRAGDLAPDSGAGGACPLGATWVTREGVFVDRIASAWLIAKFIDPQARFKFVPSKGYVPASGELRFDMYEGEFTHEGDACTFEVLLARFKIGDRALRAIADIVHDIDLKDAKFGREETAGVASLIRGIALAHDGDEARIDAGSALLDGLYAAFGRRRR